MGRGTTYNEIYSPETWEKVSKENKQLLQDFLDYKTTSGKSPQTIYQYGQMIRLFLCWNYENNKDTFFVDLKKRQLLQFFNYMVTELNSSPNRISTVKASLSSLSNYIEDILDDEFENYRNIVIKLETPKKKPVREKTILTKEQTDACLNALVAQKKYQQACYMALAISCGARKSELIQFKWEWFSDENIAYGCMWKTPEKIRTKGEGVQGLMLNKFTFIEQFKPYLDLWMKYRKENKIENEWLFIVQDGNGGYKQAEAHNADKWCETISKILGSPFYSHCARHRYVTMMKEKNLPDSVIAVLMGWLSGTSMIPIYDDSDPFDSLDEYFDKNGIKNVKQGTVNDI